MANREYSVWFFRNESDKEILINFINNFNEYGRLTMHDNGDSIYLNWDNDIFSKIYEDLPLYNYCFYRSDEFSNFFYIQFGEQKLIEANHSDEHEYLIDSFDYNGNNYQIDELNNLKDLYFINSSTTQQKAKKILSK